jgi:hypothetical protein
MRLIYVVSKAFGVLESQYSLHIYCFDEIGWITPAGLGWIGL